jgi:hypothetical protein
MEWHLSVPMKHNRRIFYDARVGNFAGIALILGGFQGAGKLKFKSEPPLGMRCQGMATAHSFTQLAC